MIRMADASAAARGDGRHRLALVRPDPWTQWTHQLAAGLLGLAVFAGCAGVATLATSDEQTRGNLFAVGLLVAAVTTVALAAWTNRKRHQ
jgi:hypothetical protein